MDPLQVVLQFLKEENYEESFNTLLKESGAIYHPETMRNHVLRQSLGTIALTETTNAIRAMISGPKFKLGEFQKRSSYDASPVSMIAFEDALICGFTDQSIRKISISNEVLVHVNPELSTVLSFAIYKDKLLCGTMQGSVLSLDPRGLIIECKGQVGNGAIIAMAVCDEIVFAASRKGCVGVLDANSLSMISSYTYDNPVTALCRVGDGAMYAVQNDSVFHYRLARDPEHETLWSMNPNELGVGCLDIREMVQSPMDPNVFVALTDQGRAHIYRYVPGAKSLSVLRILTHFLSDGLSQPQMLWKHSPVLFATSDDWTVLAIDVETDSVLFKIDGFKKATRCLAMINRKLVVGSFDKTIGIFDLEEA